MSEEPAIEYVDPRPLPEADQDVEIVWLDQSAAAQTPLRDEDIPDEYKQRGDQDATKKTPTAQPKRGSKVAPNGGTEEAAGEVAASLGRRKVKHAAAAAVEPAMVHEGTDTLIAPRESLFVRLSRHRVALVVTAVLALAAGTMAFRAYRSELDRLPQVADVNFAKGREALERGDFDAAKQMLGRAASAFERLGSKDERTSQARSLAREAGVFADLSPKSLEEILDDAGRVDPSMWPRHFEINYQGRAVIVESEIEAPPAAGESPGAYRLAYRVFVGRGPKPARTGRYDLNGLKLLEGRNLKKGDQVIFGARLAGVVYENGEWKVRLEPESGVTLTQFKLLEGLGWSRELTSGRAVTDAPRLEPAEGH